MLASRFRGAGMNKLIVIKAVFRMIHTGHAPTSMTRRDGIGKKGCYLVLGDRLDIYMIVIVKVIVVVIYYCKSSTAYISMLLVLQQQSSTPSRAKNIDNFKRIQSLLRSQSGMRVVPDYNSSNYISSSDRYYGPATGFKLTIGQSEICLRFNNQCSLSIIMSSESVRTSQTLEKKWLVRQLIFF